MSAVCTVTHPSSPPSMPAVEPKGDDTGWAGFVAKLKGCGVAAASGAVPLALTLASGGAVAASVMALPLAQTVVKGLSLVDIILPIEAVAEKLAGFLGGRGEKVVDALFGIAKKKHERKVLRSQVEAVVGPYMAEVSQALDVIKSEQGDIKGLLQTWMDQQHVVNTVVAEHLSAMRQSLQRVEEDLWYIRTLTDSNTDTLSVISLDVSQLLHGVTAKLNSMCPRECQQLCSSLLRKQKLRSDCGVAYEPNRYVARPDLDRVLAAFTDQCAGGQQAAMPLFVLTGDLGCGQTWSAAHLAHQVVSAPGTSHPVTGAPDTDGSCLLPFFLPLRNGIAAGLERYFGNSDADTVATDCATLYTAGKIPVLILDGLHEEKRKENRGVVDWVADFLQEVDKKALVLLTCRSHTWKGVYKGDILPHLFPCGTGQTRVAPTLSHSMCLGPFTDTELLNAVESYDTLSHQFSPHLVHFCRKPYALGLVADYASNNSTLPDPLDIASFYPVFCGDQDSATVLSRMGIHADVVRDYLAPFLQALGDPSQMSSADLVSCCVDRSTLKLEVTQSKGWHQIESSGLVDLTGTTLKPMCRVAAEYAPYISHMMSIGNPITADQAPLPALATIPTRADTEFSNTLESKRPQLLALKEARRLEEEARLAAQLELELEQRRTQIAGLSISVPDIALETRGGGNADDTLETSDDEDCFRSAVSTPCVGLCGPGTTRPDSQVVWPQTPSSSVTYSTDEDIGNADSISQTPQTLTTAETEAQALIKSVSSQCEAPSSAKTVAAKLLEVLQFGRVDENRATLLRSNCLDAINSALELYCESSEVVRASADVIACLANIGSCAQVSIFASGTVPKLLKGIKNHISTASTCVAVIEALTQLAASGDNVPTMLSIDDGACQKNADTAIEKHPGDPDVVSAYADLLHHLATPAAEARSGRQGSDTISSGIVLSDGVRALYKALETHKGSPCACHSLLQALGTLHLADPKVALYATGTHLLAMSAVALSHQKVFAEDVCISGSRLLAITATEGKSQRVGLMKSGAMRVLLKCLSTHRDSTGVAFWVCTAVSTLSSDSRCLPLLVPLRDSQGLRVFPAVLRAIEDHCTEAAVVSEGVSALRSYIRHDCYVQQPSVPEECLGYVCSVMESHKSCSDIATSGSRLLLQHLKTMGSNGCYKTVGPVLSRVLRHSYTDLGVCQNTVRGLYAISRQGHNVVLNEHLCYQGVILAMATHTGPDTYTMRMMGARILSKLSAGDSTITSGMVEGGVLSVVTGVLEEWYWHASERVCHTEAYLSLDNISRHETDRQTGVLGAGGARVLIKGLERHTNDTSVCLAVCNALRVMLTQVSNVASVNRMRWFNTLLKIMQTHPDDTKTVTAVASVLILLGYGATYRESATMARDCTPILLKALSQHTSDPGVPKSILWALTNLSMNGTATKHMHSLGVPLAVLDTMKSHPTHPDIVDGSATLLGNMASGYKNRPIMMSYKDGMCLRVVSMVVSIHTDNPSIQRLGGEIGKALSDTP
ncbi:hypothetical protein KIPB_004225 [Kipferlia bialata]|uniref:NACHT domain-containing protein n=1 Tax=Kipferlia bialata TaxID=797122 RepID=A0A9K3CV16_9EUKA|nr:hypothetical protein KIPB_004225 [Kipferlia bialata]|eukprot:g4225.t1